MGISTSLRVVMDSSRAQLGLHMWASASEELPQVIGSLTAGHWGPCGVMAEPSNRNKQGGGMWV